jgi:hypothetical protein
MDWTGLVHFCLEELCYGSRSKIPAVQFAADFRAISASFCSSLSSRFRGFPDMVWYDCRYFDPSLV